MVELVGLKAGAKLGRSGGQLDFAQVCNLRRSGERKKISKSVNKWDDGAWKSRFQAPGDITGCCITPSWCMSSCCVTLFGACRLLAVGI